MMNVATLQKLLAEQFPDADLSTLGDNPRVGSLAEWDSLGHFNFLLLVEERYSVRFSMDEMTEMKSLEDIAAALNSKGLAD